VRFWCMRRKTYSDNADLAQVLEFLVVSHLENPPDEGVFPSVEFDAERVG
jgi:hypothetical protein